MMGKVNVTVNEAHDVVATVNITGMILYRMYQNWALESEPGLAWWDLVEKQGVLDGEPFFECSSEYP